MKKSAHIVLVLLVVLCIVSCQKTETKEATKTEEPSITEETASETEKTEENGKDERKEEKANETEAKEETSKETTYPLTVKDGMGREVVLEKKPEKLVALSGTTLNMLSLVDGKAVAGPSLSEGAPKPDYYGEIELLGHMASIDVEKLVMLKPDLVFMQAMSAKLVPVLEENGLPYYFFTGSTFKEIVENLRTISTMIGTEEKGLEVTKKLEAEVEAVLQKVPKEESKKVAIIHVTGNGITLALPNSIAGDIATQLGMENIAKPGEDTKKGSSTSPFSLEAIVEADPDVIYVTSMISADQNVEEALLHQIQDNEAWNTVRAVKEGRLFYLPQSHFLFNPLEKFPEAIEMMAKPLWPEAFK